MKKLISLTIALISLFLFSCGGGGSSSAPAKHAPVISSLSMYPSSAHVGDGYGAVTIYMYYDFSDADANITTGFINWSDSTTGESGTISGDLGINGNVSGHAYITVVGDTSVVSTTSFQFYVTDSTGLQSNKLSGLWPVI